MSYKKFILIILAVALAVGLIARNSSRDTRQELNSYVKCAEYWDGEATKRLNAVVDYLRTGYDEYDPYRLHSILEDACYEIDMIIGDAPMPY